ncbi:MAG: hypothetical protein U5K81_15660 [Trueperaceae bacterium]|nr:hypothetical protein [Trueperaceae bacterium]
MHPSPRPPREAPYGHWSSPLDAARVAAAAPAFGDAAFDGDAVLWSQSRPEERGRTTLYRREANGEVHEVTPAPFDVRTSVHEYGGGAWAVRDGAIVFAHHADQRLYVAEPDREPRPLTPESDRLLRYADLAWTPDGTAVLAVREDHRAHDREPVNTLVSVPLSGGPEEGAVLAEGCDFYASPTPSPDGRRLAWTEWDHPNMPWDGTRLRMAALNGAGRPGPAERVAGGPDEAVQQPRFLPDGALAFVSDRSGWWNLYLHQGDEVRALWPCEQEFGQPAFALGLATMDAAGNDHVVAAFGRGRPSRLAVVPASRRRGA